jgi:hypothetical protein
MSPVGQATLGALSNGLEKKGQNTTEPRDHASHCAPVPPVAACLQVHKQLNDTYELPVTNPSAVRLNKSRQPALSELAERRI